MRPNYSLAAIFHELRQSARQGDLRFTTHLVCKSQQRRRRTGCIDSSTMDTFFPCSYLFNGYKLH